jgi:CBS domain-containing protein
VGDLAVHAATDPAEIQRFSRALLDDLEALERMCDEGLIERGVRRIGFEQEMFLVDRDGRPAPIAGQVLAELGDPTFTPEIGRYNLEHNVPAERLGPGAFRRLEDDLNAAITRARAAAAAHGGEVFLGGILPSIDYGDLKLANITPESRYYALNEVIVGLSGGTVRTLIQGRDNLQVELDNVMLESCTTSIQVHLQVDPDEIASLYRAAQVVAAPMVAIAANAPILLQHRLWHESRIPAFEQAVDIRTPDHRRRGNWQRVHFGGDWVDESVLEIYRDQVARHRLLLLTDTGESSLAVLDRGEVPKLRALTLHNGSLYRWNRPCYGVTDGVPHLRIEHRPLSSGPTILDEVANTALYVGLVEGFTRTMGDVRNLFAFSDIKANFISAARYGLGSTLRWTDSQPIAVRTLLKEQLVPLARQGLRAVGIETEEVDRYLGIIEERIASGTTGARWTLDAYEALSGYRNRGARSQALTRLIVSRQHQGIPVHRWAPVTEEEATPDTARCTRVGDLMTTDLFTVRPDDLMDVAASVMEWKHIRHVPVEDDHGALVGLVSHRDILGLLARGRAGQPIAVREVMRKSPLTIEPDTSCATALGLLRDGTLGCLPVVDSGRLVGIVTERDFLAFAEAWLDRDRRSEIGDRRPAGG